MKSAIIISGGKNGVDVIINSLSANKHCLYQKPLDGGGYKVGFQNETNAINALRSLKVMHPESAYVNKRFLKYALTSVKVVSDEENN